MCPQPLSKFKSQEWTTNSNVVFDRPEQAVMGMAIISAWARIDRLSAILLSYLIKSDVAVGVAMYETPINTVIKKTMIENAAKVSLKNDPEMLLLLQDALNKIKKARGLRDKLAHHIWATPKNIEDAICLIDPKELSRHFAESQQFEIDCTSRLGVFTNPPPEPEKLNKKIMVYKNKDFSDALEKASKCQRIMVLLIQSIDFRTQTHKNALVSAQVDSQKRHEARQTLQTELQTPL